MANPILVSGIQPTGRLHLGNYLGALKNFVDLQNSGKYECYFFVVDLHSLTEDFDPKEKRIQILDLAADYLAAGLDPKKSVIALQSFIPAHTELAWILNTITPMGELERMTQYKDKVSRMITLESTTTPEDMKDEESIRRHTDKVVREKIGEIRNVGLFDYPVLMAADILLYDASYVPVGNDQDQHLELTRTLARKFNAKFGKTFLEPEGLHTDTPRVMSLSDPMKKMSKSIPQSCLFLDDTPEVIRDKVKRAVTDSGSEIKYDPEKKPALSNLLKIYSSLSGISTEKLEKQFSRNTYSKFKSELAETIAHYFVDYRKKKSALAGNSEKLKTVLAAGSKKADGKASRKITEVKKKVGITI